MTPRARAVAAYAFVVVAAAYGLLRVQDQAQEAERRADAAEERADQVAEELERICVALPEGTCD